MGLLRLAKETAEIAPSASVMQAVKAMTARGVGALAVTVEGKIVGIFTERDVVHRMVCEGKDASTTLVREVMTSPVRTVLDEASVSDAATLMRQNHIRHLPIVDDAGNFRGMVALRYLLYDLMDGLERKVDDLQGYIMTDGPGG